MKRCIALIAIALFGACSSGDDDTTEISGGGDTQPSTAVTKSGDTTEPAVETTAPATTEAPATTAAATTTEEPTTTRAPTTTAAPTTTQPAVGTRENPVPLGTPIPADQWTYLVTGFEPAVDPILMEINQFNEPAPPGQQYIRVRLRATYNGDGPGSPLFLTINLVSPTGTTYAAVDPCCDPQVQQLTDQPETFAGGSVEGWIYYVVPNEDVFGKLLAFDPNVNYTDVPGGVGFFAVN